MNTFKPLQRKHQFPSVPTALTYPSLRPSRSLTSRPMPDSERAQPVTQEQLEHPARFGHSFGRISLFPPEKKNNTGLPDRLKTGIERLSGMSLDDVNVHYHSSKPSHLQALAYTQGADIHMGPGQERHLAHEAWHVVQQGQGRVKPTLQIRDVAINDDEGLEKEAETMGERAMQEYRGGASIMVQRWGEREIHGGASPRQIQNSVLVSDSPVIQRTRDAAENYAPPKESSVFAEVFYKNHTPEEGTFNDNIAIAKHAARDLNGYNTLINMSRTAAWQEIYDHLERLSANQSRNLVNQPIIKFLTLNRYEFIETYYDNTQMPGPKVTNYGKGYIHLQMIWTDLGNGRGYYKIFHFDRVENTEYHIQGV